MDLPGPEPAPVPRVIPLTVDIHWRWEGPQGQKCENVFQAHYATGPLSPSTMTNLAIAVATRLLSKYQAFMSNQITFKEVYVRDLSTADGPVEGRYTFPNGTVGAGTLDPLPSNVAANLMLATGRGGRTRRGSKRFGGFDEGRVTKDTLQNDLLALLQDLAIQLLLNWVVGGVTFETAVGSMKGGYSTPITAISLVDSNVDSQKTRINQRGA